MFTVQTNLPIIYFNQRKLETSSFNTQINLKINPFTYCWVGTQGRAMTLLVSTMSVSSTEKSHAIFSEKHIDSGFSVDNTLIINQCG